MIKQDDKNSDLENQSLNQLSADQIMKLSTLSEVKQILTSIKLAYFPFAGFVLKDPDAEGLKILYEYSEIFLKIKDYLKKKDLFPEE